MNERALPLPDADTAFFWAATARHELAILRCDRCGHFVHYPRPACSSCGARALTPTRVSGRGTVHSFTVTHRPVPGFEPPFVVALIELEEQPGLRMVSNIIGIEPEDVRIEMQVEVSFQPATDEVWVPLFKPRERA